MGKLRKNDTPVEKGITVCPQLSSPPQYFSSRPYLEAHVVYMKPMTPCTVLAAESQPWKFERSSAS